MPANYDNSARFYDQLSRVVFGNTLVQAQVYLLPSIPPMANIIIAGGGTGWILEEIAKVHPSGLTITYVEISAKMTALARKRNAGANRVVFINDAIENMINDTLFDVMITPFLFDNFTEATLQSVFPHLHALLKPGGIWLCTDFQLTGKVWQQVILLAMYFFFRTVCDVEANTLPDIPATFASHGYNKIVSKTFFGDFIISTCYGH